MSYFGDLSDFRGNARLTLEERIYRLHTLLDKLMEEKIDLEMKPFIYALNDIEFISTVASCAGYRVPKIDPYVSLRTAFSFETLFKAISPVMRLDGVTLTVEGWFLDMPRYRLTFDMKTWKERLTAITNIFQKMQAEDIGK